MNTHDNLFLIFVNTSFIFNLDTLLFLLLFLSSPLSHTLLKSLFPFIYMDSLIFCEELMTISILTCCLHLRKHFPVVFTEPFSSCKFHCSFDAVSFIVLNRPSQLFWCL